ncbi:MAG: radical SAM protein [Anaerostipes sp.]|jgi:radical SAM protein with 4Fe4S-binding SPASM domain
MRSDRENRYMEILDFDETKRKEWIEGRKPFSVLFELTSKCNFNCIHCYLQNNHIEDLLSYEKIIEIIDILYEKGILFLTFTGGEILTRKDFIDIYMYAKRKGFLVELFSNGYLFTDEILNVLKEFPPLLVDISLYGSSDETYEKVTGVKGAFTRVVENCKKLINHGIRISLKSPIITPILNELEKMKDIADEMGIPFVYSFEICATIDRDETPKELQVPLKCILKYEFENYYDQINNGERKAGEVNRTKIEELSKITKVYSCNVAKNSFVIDYQGRMCPCMKLRNQGIKLQKSNYQDIWNDFNRFAYIEASSKYKCKGCEDRYYCDVCPAEMEFLYGDAEYRPNIICKSAEIRRKFYEQKMTFEEALVEASFNEYIGKEGVK